MSPKTILMDEPFGALDAQLRLVMHDELLKLWSGTRKTMVFVTHDLAEAITLADRVAVFSARPGRIRAIETVDLPRPRDVFRVRFDPHFGELHDRLWSLSGSERPRRHDGGLSHVRSRNRTESHCARSRFRRTRLTRRGAQRMDDRCGRGAPASSWSVWRCGNSPAAG